MFSKLKATVEGIRTAMAAGRIVANCKTGCYLDDENEEVKACFLHNKEVEALAARNLAASEARNT